MRLLAITMLTVGLSGSYAIAGDTPAKLKPAAAMTAALKQADALTGFEARIAALSKAAKQMVALPADELGVMHRESLAYALKRETSSNKARLSYLTRAMKSAISDLRFRPRVEASMPPDFPQPGPVGAVMLKRYPAYRLARAKGGGSFWTLFQHIKGNKVEMTAPVEMTMSDSMRELDMAFLYERRDQGKTGTQGRVAVVDVPEKTWLSIGFRGSRSQGLMKRAKAWLERHAAQNGWKRAGSFRSMGYNSPMVRASSRFWEVQMPVERAPQTTTRN